MWLSDVEGVVTRRELALTVDHIAVDPAPQRNGAVVPRRPCRPLESHRGRDGAQRRRETRRRPTRGSNGWPRPSVPTDPGTSTTSTDSVEQDKLDANCVAYVAAGVWHHFLLHRDRAFLERMWDTVDAAMGFVLDLQTDRGEILWARHADGTPWTFALLTGSSSICHSLRCAIAIANELGHVRVDWELGAARLARVIRDDPDAFAPKHRWAMDWYYPVLCGVIGGDPTAASGWPRRFDAFVMDGKGVRCVSDRPWVTAAETCECVMAHLSVGDTERALDLFVVGSETPRTRRQSTGRESCFPTMSTSPEASSPPTPRRRSSSRPTPSPKALRRTGCSSITIVYRLSSRSPPTTPSPRGAPSDSGVIRRRRVLAVVVAFFALMGAGLGRGPGPCPRRPRGHRRRRPRSFRARIRDANPSSRANGVPRVSTR